MQTQEDNNISNLVVFLEEIFFESLVMSLIIYCMFVETPCRNELQSAIYIVCMEVKMCAINLSASS